MRPALSEVTLILTMTRPAPMQILMEMIQVRITYNLHPEQRHCMWRVLFILSAPRLWERESREQRRSIWKPKILQTSLWTRVVIKCN